MSYNYDTDDTYQEAQETDFYRGYVTPADEWQVTRESLFKEFTGSVFEPNAKMNRRLARLNEVVAFAESKDTKKINKKNYITDQYNFLREFIPEYIFTKITEVLAFTGTGKKKIARDIRLNVDTLASILSVWEMELLSTGNYVKEEALDKINKCLKESSSYGDFRKKGHITTKDIERAQSRILRQLYAETTNPDQAPSQELKVPVRALEYYRTFMLHIEDKVNDHQQTLLKKNPVLPFHVYLLAQRLEILKRILPKLSLDYFKRYLELEDQEKLAQALDTFYSDKPSMVGEIQAQGIVLLEQLYNQQVSTDTLPKKFSTRIRKYRLDYGAAFRQALGQKTEPEEPALENKVEPSLSEEDELVQDIHDRITELTAPYQEQPNEANDTTYDPSYATMNGTELAPEAEPAIESLNDEKDLKELWLDQKNQDPDFIAEKKEYLQRKYAFMKQEVGMPEEVFDSILDLMVYTGLTYMNGRHMRYGLNVSTIAIILAWWQLLRNTVGNYVREEAVEQLNTYLREKRWAFTYQGAITSKKISLAETSILRGQYTYQMTELLARKTTTNSLSLYG